MLRPAGEGKADGQNAIANKDPKNSNTARGSHHRNQLLKRNYFIARSGKLDAEFADDEAALEIEGIIAIVGRKYEKFLNQSISPVAQFETLHRRDNKRLSFLRFGNLTRSPTRCACLSAN